jgi:acyl carrier protein
VDTRESILADVSGMLCAVLQVDEELGPEITGESTFFTDMGMESIDVVALVGRIYSRYGNSVNLATFLGRLDLDQVKKLRVGDLVDYIQEALTKQGAPT